MNRLINKLIKIIASFFIANMALVTSNSLCMLAIFTSSMRHSSHTVHHIQRRNFGSVPIISLKKYNSLLKEVKEDDQRLHRLKNDFYLNPNAIDKIQKAIDKKRRILNTCRIEPSNDPCDDIYQ